MKLTWFRLSNKLYEFGQDLHAMEGAQRFLHNEALIGPAEKMPDRVVLDQFKHIRRCAGRINREATEIIRDIERDGIDLNDGRPADD